MLPASGQLSYEPMIEQFSCDIVQLLPLYMFFFWWGRGSIANELANAYTHKIWIGDQTSQLQL